MKKFLIFLMCLSGAQSVYADLYDIATVPVAAELSSAQEARTAAIQNGESEAFWILMKKMVAPDDLSKIEIPSPDEVVDLVQKVSVANEKTTATKYMADLTVRFQPDKVQQFLKQKQLPFLTKSLPPTVVLPIFEKNDYRLVLEDQNPVYAYLKSIESTDMAADMIIPVGDLEEVVLARQLAESQSDDIIRTFLNRYDVNRCLLLWIRQRGPYVSVRSEIFPDQSDQVIPESFEMTVPTGRMADLMPALWQKVIAEQEELWRRENTDGMEISDVFWVQVPIVRLTDWVAVHQRLKQSDLLKQVDVRGFRPGMVLITLTYHGRMSQLQTHLHKLGLDLTVDGITGLSVLKEIPQGGHI